MAHVSRDTFRVRFLVTISAMQLVSGKQLVSSYMSCVNICMCTPCMALMFKCGVVGGGGGGGGVLSGS